MGSRLECRCEGRRGLDSESLDASEERSEMDLQALLIVRMTLRILVSPGRFASC